MLRSINHTSNGQDLSSDRSEYSNTLVQEEIIALRHRTTRGDPQLNIVNHDEGI